MASSILVSQRPARELQVMDQFARLLITVWLGLLLPVNLAAQVTADTDKLPAGLAVDRIMQRAAQMPRLHSLLISHRGETVAECYFAGKNASQPANLKSASKSVISALVGLAIQHGYIRDVDQPLSDFFPEYLGTDLE